MASVFRSRFFRRCLALFFFGDAFFIGCYGVLLLFEAFAGHGSPVGNTLLFGLGLFLLVLSPIVFVLGVITWRVAHPSREDTDS
jgi:hypothetical protein